MTKREVWVIEKKPLGASADKYRPREIMLGTGRKAKETARQYNRLIADCEYRAVRYIPEVE